jgi:hypothetical protein
MPRPNACWPWLATTPGRHLRQGMDAAPDRRAGLFHPRARRRDRGRHGRSDRHVWTDAAVIRLSVGKPEPSDSPPGPDPLLRRPPPLFSPEASGNGPTTAMSAEERVAIRQVGAEDAWCSGAKQGPPERVEGPATIAVLAALLRHQQESYRRSLSPHGRETGSIVILVI